MDWIVGCLLWVDELIWGPPLLMLILGVGIYFTVRLEGVQVLHLRRAFRWAFGRDDRRAEGDATHFQSLALQLMATVGAGNVAGISSAVATGGVGALFWMWLFALTSSATRYGEVCLAIKYRVKNDLGEMAGGPMYVLDRGLGWKKAAVFFGKATK